MLTIAGGIILAVIILYAIPFIFVGAGAALGAIVDGIDSFIKWCRDTIKTLLAPIAKALIKLFQRLHISEEDWGFALAIIVLLIFLVVYLWVYTTRG